LSFAAVKQGGRPKKKTLTLKNTGRGPLTLQVGSLTAPFAHTGSAAAFLLAAHGRRKVTVTFSPGWSGVVRGTLVITSSDPARATVGVTLSGTGR